jgi:hypothetical protein
MRVFSLPLSFEAKFDQETEKITNHPGAEGNGRVLRLRQSNVNIPLKGAGEGHNALNYWRLLVCE